MVVKLQNSIVFLTSPEFSDYALANMKEVIIIFTMLMIFIVSIVVAMHHIKKLELMKMLNEDSLTGLMSEILFFKLCTEKLSNANSDEFVLISIDIDNFKYINEVYGYENGSKILIEFAENLRKVYAGDYISRINQDEFLVLTKMNANVRNNLENDDVFNKKVKEMLGFNYNLTISKGIYVIGNTNEDLHYMLDCANYARVSVKSKYGNTCVEFTENMREKVKIQNHIISNMERAIERREFCVMFQTKVSIKTDEITGAEALVRWKYKEKRVAYPDDFIRIFEQNQFIGRLDLYVFNEVCEFIANNRGKLNIPPISVNLSGITFLSESLVAELLYLLQKHNVLPSEIELEITESTVINKVERVAQRIIELKKVGFFIAMDDFGSGVSSINRLKDLEVDELKIDKTFLKNIFDDKGTRGSIILENILNMACELGMSTVVEGVETKAQYDLLKSMKCDKVQGFFFSKPISHEQFIAKIKAPKI